MGYTHYWSYLPEHDQFRAAWPRMVLDAKTVLDRVGDQHGITLRGPGGEGDPVLSEGAIGFNGDAAADEDYESFWLTYAVEPGTRLAEDYTRRGFVWNFCKTARRPYDLAVATVLLRCHLPAPDAVAISSDGDWDGDWRPARTLHGELFGDPGEVDPFTNTTRGPRAGRTTNGTRR